MEPILCVKNISKKIKNNLILDDISFTVNKGEIMGIKGRNGSGKSMLFKALTGLIALDKGEVRVFGKSINEENALSEIGALIEYPGFLPNFTGKKNLLMLASIRNAISEDAIIEAMQKLKLDPNNKLPYKKYSIGMRQKLGIAAAIMELPKLLFLDEPCNNLDVESAALVHEILRKLNKENNTTIIMASHNVSDFEMLCTTMCEIKSGRLEVIQ